MNDLKEKITNLSIRLEEALKLLNLEIERAQAKKLEVQTIKPDFWDNPEKAQGMMQELANYNKHLDSWDAITSKINELAEMVAETKENEQDIVKEIEQETDRIAKNFEKLEFELMFIGPYDQNNAIISFSAGSGGTDASDWAEMLLSMYLKYAEIQGFQTTLLDESRADEAGIKSATLEVIGKYAYGYLKSEHGVHRLVRISPYDADKARHTSFALVEVVPEITESELTIDNKELRIDTFRSSGHGGQSVNTTDSAVRITHIPTGISATSQNERSQLQNRDNAFKILRSRLVDLEEKVANDKLKAIKGKPISAEWGNQIRSYVLQPYTLVKDSRTGYEESDVNAVLSGKIDKFTEAYLKHARESHKDS